VKKFEGGDSETISGIALSKDGKLVASACESQGLRIWDVAMAKEINAISSYGRHVIAISFAPDGSSIAAAMEGGTVMTFGLQNGER
jgi:WD40 repeat protein